MKNLSWVAVRGRFKFDDAGHIVFQGEAVQNLDGTTGVATGVAICNERFSGGVLSADIVFDRWEPHSDCEIILWYHPERMYFVCAGISGEPAALFTIKYFDTKWNYIAAVGEGLNLEVGRRYNVKVHLRGSRVALVVDGVEVLAGTLPFPLPPAQAGVFCRGAHSIRVSNFVVDSEVPRAFVVMEFKSPFNELHQDVIRTVCREFGIEAVRADETYGPGLIIADIEKQIDEAKFIIAEITPANPNVYYEVGYARARRKPTILLADRTMGQLPFDVSPFRTLFYENTIAGKTRIEEALRRHIRAVLAEPGF